MSLSHVDPTLILKHYKHCSLADYIWYYSKDLDPCINVTCDYFAVCKAFDAFDARCVCEENCPSYEEQVCSSNSTTFKNKCMFELDICRLKSNHTLYHPGSCTGKKYICDHLHVLEFIESRAFHLARKLTKKSINESWIPLPNSWKDWDIRKRHYNDVYQMTPKICQENICLSSVLSLRLRSLG